MEPISLDNLIDRMCNIKGITLKYNTYEEVKDYLLNKNNYLRTASYRKNFQKYQGGINEGKYINLDFKYLVELSTIDRKLRNIIIQMCIDIEHKLKINMLKDIEAKHINSLEITEKFLDNNKSVLNNIERSSSSPHTGNLIKKYFELECKEDEETNKKRNEIIKYDGCPIWVLVEIVGFGDFIKCYKFCYDEIKEKAPIAENILNSIRSIRNCCAHNNCLINNLHTKKAHAPTIITKFISDIKTIKDKQRKNKLSCRPILEVVSVLYAYDKLDIKSKELDKLEDLFLYEIPKNKEYFITNELLVTQYRFILEVIKYIKNS